MTNIQNSKHAKKEITGKIAKESTIYKFYDLHRTICTRDEGTPICSYNVAISTWQELVVK
jgi:hypothetical protein